MLNKETFKVDIDKQRNIIEVSLIKENISVCKCRMYTDNSKKNWTVSSWYTNKNFLHQGFGKKTLDKTVWEMYKQFGYPEKVDYIWNGANKYVFNWLYKNFDAKSSCPIAVQKYATDDDWSSHIYNLNKDKFLNYFGIENQKKISKIINELER